MARVTGSGKLFKGARKKRITDDYTPSRKKTRGAKNKAAEKAKKILRDKMESERGAIKSGTEQRQTGDIFDGATDQQGVTESREDNLNELDDEGEIYSNIAWKGTANVGNDSDDIGEMLDEIRNLYAVAGAEFDLNKYFAGKEQVGNFVVTFLDMSSIEGDMNEMLRTVFRALNAKNPGSHKSGRDSAIFAELDNYRESYDGTSRIDVDRYCSDFAQNHAL